MRSSVDIPVDVVVRWDVEDVNEWDRCPVHLVLRGEPVATMWLPLNMAEGEAMVQLLAYAVRKRNL